MRRAEREKRERRINSQCGKNRANAVVIVLAAVFCLIVAGGAGYFVHAANSQPQLQFPSWSRRGMSRAAPSAIRQGGRRSWMLLSRRAC